MVQGWTTDVSDNDEVDQSVGSDEEDDYESDKPIEGSIPERSQSSDSSDDSSSDSEAKADEVLDKMEDGESSNENDQMGGGGWGSSEPEEQTSETEDNSSNAPDAPVKDDPGSGGSNPEPEPETPQNVKETPSDGSGGGPPDVGGVSVSQAAKTAHDRWRVLVWGPAKLFKTHFCYTMPGPVVIIDTEAKSEQLSPKFQGKDVLILNIHDMPAEPNTKFRQAKEALKRGIEWLDWWREEEGRIGSITVDSMSDIWEYAQEHHKIENYPLKDASDIQLSSNFGSSSESDWAIVKRYHNGEFRDLIVNSPYHFCWTAKERVAFNETFEDEENRQFLEPRGETNNDYYVDTIIRARRDKDRGKVGDLIGSNYIDNSFVGLKKPTFPKVRDAIEHIQSVEGGNAQVSRSKLADEIGAETIIDYDTQVYVQS